MFKNLIFVILISLAINRIYAQDISFEHYTIEQGLSQNVVQCIYQDSRGYIWVGTEDGLNRFDGYSFTIFSTDPNDQASLSDNFITKIFEDHNGNLWIGTNNGGLNVYNYETGKFKRYQHNDKDNGSLAFNDVWSIYEDSRKTLWIGNYFGGAINIFQPKTDKFKHFTLGSTGPNSTIFFFHEDKEHQFWIGTIDGLYLYNRKNGHSILYQPNKDKELPNAITSIAEGSNGMFWLGGFGRMYKFEKKTGKFECIWHNNQKFNNLVDFNLLTTCLNDNQFLWFGNKSNSGLLKFNKTTQTFTRYTHDKAIGTSISSNDVISLCEDKAGEIWVGTNLAGINKFEKKKKFDESLKGISIGCFCETGKRFTWVGTLTKGLYRYDNNANTWSHYTVNKNPNNSLIDSVITDMFVDHKGVLWVGTFNGGLNRITFSGNNPLKFTIDHVTTSKTVKAITEDSQNRLWIGCDNDWLLYYPDDNQFVPFRHDPKNPNSISSTNVQTAINDNQTGDIWIATWYGLNRMILPENGTPTTSNVKFEHLLNDPENINSISDNRVISLCMDQKGVLWAGTCGGGLNKIEIERKNDAGQYTYKIKRFTKKNGLPDNVIYGILEDTHGNLWLSTNKGLSKFDPVREIFHNFDMNDGLQSDEFFWRAYYKGPSGKMYFGGSNGYNAFYPDSIRPNPYIPPVYITGFSIFNKPQIPGASNSPLKEQISETNEISINYNQSVISFDYVALNYISLQKNKYAYKMEGFDKDWQYVGNQRRATYTNLDPGMYTFRVKASNNDGVWNNKGASVTLIIKPPFWKTTWFRLLAIVFIISSLVSLYLLRVASIRRKNYQLGQLVKERTREIEEKNKALSEQTEILSETNTLLVERQKKINEQATILQNTNALLKVRQQQIEEQSDSLNITNTLLEERQQQIEEQSEELKAQRDQLSQLNVTKDKLFSILAHDLRNPFHVIIGFSELLVSDFKRLSEDKIQRFLGLIHSSSIRGNDLLENILQWSRAQTGRITFDPEEQYLSEIADEVISLLEGSAQQKHITINQLVDPKVIVIADKNMLKTILRNLFSNAIKFTPEKGHITLKAEISINSAYVEVAVSDTGVGIPEATLKNLFRVDTTVTTKGTAQEAGTGLGLIICKEFVEKHKGKIWVQSQVNTGSTFYFTLPCKPDRPGSVF